MACCLTLVLSSRRPPILLRVLVSPVPRSQRRYEGATTSHPRIRNHLWIRCRGPLDPPGLVSRHRRSRKVGGPFQARDFVTPAALVRFDLAWTRMGSLRSPGGPSRTFAPFQDPGRTDMTSPLAVTSVLPPLSGRRRLRHWLISGLHAQLQYLLPTLRAQRYRARARLASGWLASLYREGVKPSGPLREVSVRSHIHPPLLFS